MRGWQQPARWRWRVAQAEHLELRAGIGIPQQLSRADDIVRLPREGRIGALLSRIGALLSRIGALLSELLRPLGPSRSLCKERRRLGRCCGSTRQW